MNIFITEVQVSIRAYSSDIEESGSQKKDCEIDKYILKPPWNIYGRDTGIWLFHDYFNNFPKIYKKSLKIRQHKHEWYFNKKNVENMYWCDIENGKWMSSSKRFWNTPLLKKWSQEPLFLHPNLQIKLNLLLHYTYLQEKHHGIRQRKSRSDKNQNGKQQWHALL